MDSTLILSLRKHQEFFVNSSELELVEKEKTFNSSEVAVLVIGMWSGHQCLVADTILHELSPKVNTFLKTCRSKNMKVIFGSSSLTKLPKYVPLRKNMKGLAFAKLVDRGLSFPPIPFDDSDGGVNQKNPNFKRDDVDLHPSIEVADTDAMSDNSKEILNYLYHHNIKLLLVVGVHTNMCVLDRPYGIKNLARYGFPMAIVRDLADPMIKPDGIKVKDRADALDKIIRYTERYFCPSVDSRDMVFFNKDKRIIRCDIDETICTLGPCVEGQDNHPYKIKVPLPERIEKINKLYDEGNAVVYWTSRGIDSSKDWTDFTRKQLESWGVRYSAIICGKRRFDLFIDDKAQFSEAYFS
jgi:nicotinamidase-related amidase